MKKKTLITEHPESLQIFGGDKGTSWASFELKHYADPKTVRVTMDGDVITPYGFNLYGEPLFSREVYQEYDKRYDALKEKNGNWDEAPKLEVTYCKKFFTIPVVSFDTIEGITRSLKDLATFNEMLNARMIYSRRVKSDLKLEQFFVFGMFFLDCMGNIMIVTERKSDLQADKDRTNCFKDIPVIFPYEFFQSYSAYSLTRARIPNAESKCKICGKGWTINDLKCDEYAKFNYTYVDGDEYHRDCYNKQRHDEEVTKFQDIFAQVYPGIELKFDEISNGYCHEDCCRHIPWFIFHTPDGDIKIGWRKRVISIRWLKDYRNFAETFESEKGITKGFNEEPNSDAENSRYIHAWGTEKAIEYLNRAKNSIK